MSRLNKLIAQAKRHVMTEEEREEQRISFAYGNAKMSNPKITRELVQKAAKNLANAPNRPMVDERVYVALREHPESCDMRRGDTQCNFVKPNGGGEGYLNCGLILGHKDNQHHDSYDISLNRKPRAGEIWIPLSEFHGQGD